MVNNALLCKLNKEGARPLKEGEERNGIHNIAGELQMAHSDNMGPEGLSAILELFHPALEASLTEGGSKRRLYYVIGAFSVSRFL